jgi:predicted nucleic acid-binding protein
VIFLDTSAIYALADKADPNHASAYGKFALALESKEILLVHSYVLVESAALLQARLGLHSALLFLRDATAFDVEWVDLALHEAAMKELEKIGKKGIGLVDCMSFVVMRRRGVQRVLAFDPDFHDQGFAIY